MIKANAKQGPADVYGCQHKGGVDACAESNCCTYLNRDKMRRKRVITIAATNIGIFTLLVIYTLLGACIFMSIEGGATIAAQKSLSSSTLYQQQAKTKLAEKTLYHFNATVTQASALLRSQAVENIWEITVSLNILYKDNWTRLAAQEISRFEDQLIQRMTSEMSSRYNVAGKALQVSGRQRVEVNSVDEHDWSFAKAFLYSLTVLTTIGYGRVTPRTGLGKVVTIGYAVIGIPLTLLYLSIVGSVLSKIARSVCFRTICCCLCSKCNYCCYIKPWEGEKEKMNKDNRQDITEITNRTMQEPYYVRSPSGTIISAAQAHRAITNPASEKSFSFMGPCDSSGHESNKKTKSFSILAPVLLCLCTIFAYILFGALILYNLENLSPIDGVYFCFMSLSTIGFSSLVSSPGIYQNKINSNSTVWFCSLYIMTGLALTAMCFNVLHDEIVYRIKHSESDAKPTVDHKALATQYLHQS